MTSTRPKGFSSAAYVHLLRGAVHLERGHGLPAERLRLGDAHRGRVHLRSGRVPRGRREHVAAHRLGGGLQQLEAARLQQEAQLPASRP